MRMNCTEAAQSNTPVPYPRAVCRSADAGGRCASRAWLDLVRYVTDGTRV